MWSNKALEARLLPLFYILGMVYIYIVHEILLCFVGMYASSLVKL